ncbi:unnamed protein product, partial [Iphiclides podalirius]
MLKISSEGYVRLRCVCTSPRGADWFAWRRPRSFGVTQCRWKHVQCTFDLLGRAATCVCYGSGSESHTCERLDRILISAERSPRQEARRVGGRLTREEAAHASGDRSPVISADGTIRAR